MKWKVEKEEEKEARRECNAEKENEDIDEQHIVQM